MISEFLVIDGINIIQAPENYFPGLPGYFPVFPA
jgi:hypothetical protein